MEDLCNVADGAFTCIKVGNQMGSKEAMYIWVMPPVCNNIPGESMRSRREATSAAYRQGQVDATRERRPAHVL